MIVVTMPRNARSAGQGTYAILSLAVVLVASACIAGAAPAPSATPTPAPTTSSVDLQTRFAGLVPGPAFPGSVWSMDQPIRLPPRAFGGFSEDDQPGAVLGAQRFRLATALPRGPSEIDVALVGVYDETWRGLVTRTVAEPAIWDIVPQYASLSSNASASVGVMPPPSPVGLAEARAILTRNGLLAPDMEPHPHPGPGRFEFIRHLGQIPVWTNLGVALNGRTGGPTQARGRRRPILAVSSYPLRPAAQAWALLAAGKGRTMYVDDGAPHASAHLDEFVATSVELVYLELQVLRPREIMQPYYAFRDDAGHTLYIPATAF